MEHLEAGSEVSRATIYRKVGGKEQVLALLAEERGIGFVPKADTRRMILEAAGRVLSVRGPFASTMDDVATAAGVGVATVYRHFGDKESLTRAFLEETTPRSLIRAAALHPSDDVQVDLERIVGVMVGAFLEHRDLIRLMYLTGDDDRAYLNTLREPADSTLVRLATFFQAHLDAGRLDTPAGAEELASVLMGMVLFTTVVGPMTVPSGPCGPPDPRHLAEVVVAVFLRDLRSGREASR